MVIDIPHVLHVHEDGSILRVATDLRLTPGTPGFDAEERYLLGQRVGKLLGRDTCLQAEIYYQPPGQP